MQCCEAIVLGLVDGAIWGEVGEDQPHGTHVPTQGGVVQTVEAVAIGHGDVDLCRFHQELHHVVTLLGNGVMEGRVALRILGEEEEEGLSNGCTPIEHNTALTMYAICLQTLVGILTTNKHMITSTM